MAIINKYIHVFEIGMKTTSVFCNIPQELGLTFGLAHQ